MQTFTIFYGNLVYCGLISDFSTEDDFAISNLISVISARATSARAYDISPSSDPSTSVRPLQWDIATCFSSAYYGRLHAGGQVNSLSHYFYINSGFYILLHMSDHIVANIQKCIKHLDIATFYLWFWTLCAFIAVKILHLHLVASYCNFFSTAIVNANWIIPCWVIELFNWFVTANITDVNVLEWLQKFKILTYPFYSFLRYMTVS